MAAGLHTYSQMWVTALPHIPFRSGTRGVVVGKERMGKAEWKRGYV